MAEFVARCKNDVMKDLRGYGRNLNLKREDFPNTGFTMILHDFGVVMTEPQLKEKVILVCPFLFGS